MEQRRLRLGDILDDYCPRERRVTNHAVVAMIEEDVKQTRCTTCDAEHVYKGGKAPRRKKGESTGALYKEVLAGIEEPVMRGAPPDDVPAEHEPSAEPVHMADSNRDLASDVTEPEDMPEETADMPDADDSQLQMLPDEGPVHRPLIRAQLPRVEGVKLERQAPEFTIRQNNGRNGGFRGRGFSGGGGNGSSGGGNGANGSGHRFGRGPNRGGGTGSGRPDRGGGGGGQGFGRNSGPRKRSR